MLMGGNCSKKKVIEPIPIKFSSYIDRWACWSPSGDSLAYHHWLETEIDSSGLYIMDSSGVFKRFFLWGPSIYDPDWSPMGDWIALEVGYHIYKIQTDRDSLIQLTYSGENILPRWSPDGMKIVYQKISPVESLGIWIMDADGNNSRFAINGISPSWSPDGTEILYVGLNYQLFVADTTGENAVQIGTLTGGTGTQFPSFSPQGDKILFSYQIYSERPNIWVMNTDGSNLQKLTTQGGDAPRWSPDGYKITFTDTRPENGYLWIMNRDGTEKRQLTF
jgi:TolB protein